MTGVPWVFYAGLTNLDYAITVSHTTTGQTFNTYHTAPPPGGSFQNFGNFDVGRRHFIAVRQRDDHLGSGRTHRLVHAGRIDALPAQQPLQPHPVGQRQSFPLRHELCGQRGGHRAGEQWLRLLHHAGAVGRHE